MDELGTHHHDGHADLAELPTDLFKIPADVDVGRFHPDGKRLIALKDLAPAFKADRIEAILNWFQLVKTRASGH